MDAADLPVALFKPHFIICYNGFYFLVWYVYDPVIFEKMGQNLVIKHFSIHLNSLYLQLLTLQIMAAIHTIHGWMDV